VPLTVVIVLAEDKTARYRHDAVDASAAAFSDCQLTRRTGGQNHSHSIVPGGFDVTS